MPMKKFCLTILLASIATMFLVQTAQAKALHVISRQEWGANESFTLEQEKQIIPTAGTSSLTLEEIDEKSAELEQDPEIDHVVTQDPNGKKYIWPLQYAKHIKFIVIHHTAVMNNLDNPLQDIKNIYHSHAVVKGWGDIGYHYLIDREGHVYEGKKGGPGVIGGHAKPVNKVSVGIALMGNYNDGELPPAMVQATFDLLAYLAKQYKIDPLGKTEYKEKTYYNIHGHSDNTPKLDPGRFFRQKFDYLRRLLKYKQSKKLKNDPAKYDFLPLSPYKFITLLQGEEKEIMFQIKNTGGTKWNRNTYLENTSDPSLPRVLARLAIKKVLPGETGIFRGTIPEIFISGMRMPNVRLAINGSVKTAKTFPAPFMVEAVEKPLRVALGFSKKTAEIRSAEGMVLRAGDNVQKIREFKKNEIATVVMLKSGKYRVKIAPMRPNLADKKIDLLSPPRFFAKNSGILELVNFENRPKWNKNLNDNLFKGVLEFQKLDGKLTAINELPLEDYLKGIAEISNNDPREKIKTIIILARSYAKYYRDIARKFPGEPYDLDDNPDHTQKYVGYGLALRSPNIVSAVDATAGRIVTYQGKPVLTPYFNQSDGRTRSAKEAWDRNDLPYLQSVEDGFCGATELNGHGVGLSGCGATALAHRGKTVDEIIKYYYKGVEITD